MKRRPAEHLFDTLSKGRRAANAVKAVDRRHPEDYTIGLPVCWYRHGLVMTGHVTKVTYDKHRPAYVRGKNGRTYIPHAADYCNDPGVYIGTLQDNVNQAHGTRVSINPHDPYRLLIPHQTGTSRVSVAKLRKLMRSAPPWAMGANHIPNLKPGVFIAGTLIGLDEYAKQLGYEPRAPLPEDAPTLRQARYVLRDLHAKHPDCGYGKMADACERAADCAQGVPAAKPVPGPDFKGWYTHGCGQWVHDKLAPCSVCKPKRKRK